MRIKIYKTVIITLLCVAALYGVVCCLGSQRNMWVDRHEGRLGFMPLSGLPIVMEVAPGLRFKLDTGSDMSTINEADIERLREMGYNVHTSIYPVFGRDGVCDIDFSLRRYTVDLPLNDYEFIVDSLGNVISRPYSGSVNVLHNVDFVPTTDTLSVLGIDFLECFKVEYNYGYNALGLYFERPDNYQICVSLNYSRSPMEAVWLGKRYYMPLSIETVEGDYFVDTGIQRAMVKLPEAESMRSTHHLVDDTIRSLRGSYPALVDDRAWVECGARAGRFKAYYYDNDEEPYAVNPFNLFTQDVLIDFAALELCLRPHYHMPAHKLKDSSRSVPRGLSQVIDSVESDN